MKILDLSSLSISKKHLLSAKQCLKQIATNPDHNKLKIENQNTW